MSLEAGMPVFDDDHRLEYQDTEKTTEKIVLLQLDITDTQIYCMFVIQ